VVRLKSIAWRLLALMMGECLVGRAQGSLVQDSRMMNITNFTLTTFLVIYTARTPSLYQTSILGNCIRNLLNLPVYHYPWDTCNEIRHLCTSMITPQTIQ
jgi:hypothetical protein